MPRRRPIRDKLLFGGLLVGSMVVTLSASSFLGVYSYRRLVRALSCRAGELPRASELGESVGLLRLAHARAFSGHDPSDQSFSQQLAETAWALDRYSLELAEGELDNMPFGDRSRERETAREITACLRTIEMIAPPGVDGDGHLVNLSIQPAAKLAEIESQEEWRLGKRLAIETHLERLATLSAALPSYLQERLHDLSHEVRIGYRTLIFTTGASAMAAVALLAALGILTYRWVFRPLRLLGQGSRRVASGDFAFRLELDTQDEMAELAHALNDMTQRFQEIRDDLDRQVQLRTREVIRSEQLASVGFLAAGVAHEINNPLASIAMCAESLESRLEKLTATAADVQATKRYLELIQNEAFRCKGITEKLLDFSRLGEVRRQATAIMSLVSDVADMLRHVGRFAGKTIEIEEGIDVLLLVNPQEIKQVVLNLLVNALDCIDQSGKVCVSVKRSGREAVLSVVDNGCGMTDEVLEHLFEPFFTRRKAGQGTGLGLSIVHRIIADHGGRIEATSAGPDQGSIFLITLPIADVGGMPLPAVKEASKEIGKESLEEVDHHNQAA
ncbi:MAG: HAMP domain-containing sensor histidine kinase [Planctomycetia bacterium]|nr:HAMP domain-containing sensor histidine kinase [Planctomycetia bacterium]RLT14885.1 MAG: sensor histidine kinase [Planctomycetota bacterium]